MNGLKPVALITGASSGIGSALARVFAANGHQLVLVGRRLDDLNALADELAATRNGARPLVIALDLARMDTPARIAHEMGARGLEAAYVVNNAGYGIIGDAHEGDRAEQLGMIDVNARALTELSLRFLDSVTRHRGGILNVSSVAAYMPGPGMALYHATKAYVVSFSEALHTELAPLGVRVSVLCPGPVPTKFQERAGIELRLPGFLTHSAEWVAQQGYKGLMKNKRVVIPGWSNKVMRYLVTTAPRRLLLRAVHRSMRHFSARPRWPRLR